MWRPFLFTLETLKRVNDAYPYETVTLSVVVEAPCLTRCRPSWYGNSESGLECVLKTGRISIVGSPRPAASASTRS